jgi:hypothetical protein
MRIVAHFGDDRLKTAVRNWRGELPLALCEAVGQGRTPEAVRAPADRHHGGEFQRHRLRPRNGRDRARQGATELNY